MDGGGSKAVMDRRVKQTGRTVNGDGTITF